MNCKACKEPAITRISKSEKNNGKEFYSCPKGCQGWIGWVDKSLNVPREKKPYVPKPAATPMPNTSPDELYINEDNEVGCKACGKTCMIKRSSSEKNYGKEYYACQDFCNIWNGWVEDEGKPACKKTKDEGKPPCKKTKVEPHVESKVQSKAKAKAQAQASSNIKKEVKPKVNPKVVPKVGPKVDSKQVESKVKSKTAFNMLPEEV